MLKFTNINEKHGLIEYSVESEKGEVSGRIDFYTANKAITFNLKAKTVPGQDTTALEDIGLFLAALGGDILLEAQHPVEYWLKPGTPLVKKDGVSNETD